MTERWCRVGGCNEPPLFSSHWCRKHHASGQQVPQPANTELSIAAAEVREFERKLRDAHAPWQNALSIPCPVHGVDRGEYCYGRAARAVCKERVFEAMGRKVRHAS